MRFGVTGHVSIAVREKEFKARTGRAGAEFGSPLVLEPFRALAGPAPDAEPDVEEKADDPKGVPCAQRLPACVPLVLAGARGARAVRRDGQECDDRDNLHRIRTKQTNTLRPPVNSWTAANYVPYLGGVHNQ